jgi:M6 family metalloprotease-like protein
MVVPPSPDSDAATFDYWRQRAISLEQQERFHHHLVGPVHNNSLCQNQTHTDCPHRRHLQQSTGAVKFLVLLVRFTDHVNRTLPSLSDIQTLFFGTTWSDLIPTGSIQEYLRVNSYNLLSLQADVYDWVTTDNTEAFYSYGNSGLELATEQMNHAVLNYWSSQGVDLAQYDSDGNGEIDFLISLHSGYPAETGGTDCTNPLANDKQRIWSHGIGHSTAYSWQSSNLKSGPYMIGSALRGSCGSDINRIGVLTHELIHLWGVPDLYDTNGDWIGKGVGSYDIMGNPYGLVGDQTLPSNLSPWTKMQLGWLEPTLIESDGLYTVQASVETPLVYKISAGFPSPNEYLLIENRQPLKWDASFTGGGLVIWHIDNDASGQRNRGYPAQDGWPMNNKHYQVAVLQADRRYDLEVGNNQGDADDFYVQGKEIGPAPIEDSPVTAAFHPSTNSYHFGRPLQTGISIYDISASGMEMTFQVSGVSATDPPTPEPVDPPTLAPTPVPSTTAPTPLPTTLPTSLPTAVVFQPTIDAIPTQAQTVAPTLSPTQSPTPLPTVSPTPLPTVPLTPLPTVVPATLAPITPFPTEPLLPTPISGPPPRDTSIPTTPSPTVAAPSTSMPQAITVLPTELLITTSTGKPSFEAPLSAESPTPNPTTVRQTTRSPTPAPTTAGPPPTRNPLTYTPGPSSLVSPGFQSGPPLYQEASNAGCFGSSAVVFSSVVVATIMLLLL